MVMLANHQRAHNGREDGEQSFRHTACFRGFAVVRA
jgi:hypothetical protein